MICEKSWLHLKCDPSTGEYITNMATRGALCLLVIALPPDSNSSTETTPKSPFSAPISMACQRLTGVMQTTARTICEQKDSLNVFSILLAKVLKGG